MNKRRVGSEYEKKAAQYLENLGMQILAKNYRVRFGEIDLIAKDGETVVFAEVKYRAAKSQGSPLEAVDARKRRTIVRTARHFLLRYGYAPDTPCRFDVVGILGEETIYVRDAFWAQD